MGASQVKPREASGPIVDDMKKKYGSDSVKFLSYWHDQFGFPKNGSLSVRKIEYLEQKLDEYKSRLHEKKKIKRKTWIFIVEMESVLKMWETEAESRRRKTERKKKPKDKTHKAAAARQHAAPSSGSPTSHSDCVTPAPVPQAQAPPTSSADVNRDPKPSLDCQQSPVALAPPAGQLSPDLVSNAGGEGAAARRALEVAEQGKPDGTGATDTRLHTGLQPEASRPNPSRKGKGPLEEPTHRLYKPFWTVSEMKEMMMKHLPPVTPNGEKFAKEFLLFCKSCMPTIPQVNYLLGMHLTPGQYLKVKAAIGVSDCDCGPMNEEWAHKANAPYREAITGLCNVIRKVFPIEVNYWLITNTTQREGETPYEFLTRLRAVFDDHSGLSKPDDGVDSYYECSLAHYLLEGLLPPIKKRLNSTCIMSKTLQSVLSHANHAYRHLQKEASEKAMVISTRQVPAGWGRQKGWGGRRGRGRRWRDGCFICGAYDHWQRECPENYSGYCSGQRRLAIGQCFLTFVEPQQSFYIEKNPLAEH